MGISFLAQVSELPSPGTPRDDSEVKEEVQSGQAVVPKEAKKPQRNLSAASVPSKYRGYEELLTAMPDPTFAEPKGEGMAMLQDQEPSPPGLGHCQDFPYQPQSHPLPPGVAWLKA